MAKIEKILITRYGKKFFVKDLTKDFHTQFGFIKAKDLKRKDGSKIKSNKGKRFFIFSAGFIDNYSKISRGPQIIPRKDIGVIISETGINNKSKIVDSGTGSGALACFLANIAGKVVSYEIRKDFFKIAKLNKENLCLENLKLKNRDIYEGISERNVDLITLDLPEPWKVIEHAAKSLKHGGFLINYSPTIPQVMDFVKAVKKNENFVYLKTVELMQREWEFDNRKVRPMSRMMGHSGFLSFVRRV